MKTKKSFLKRLFTRKKKQTFSLLPYNKQQLPGALLQYGKHKIKILQQISVENGHPTKFYYTYKFL